MWPQEILAKYTQKEESAEQPEFCYDEFGFRVDKEDGASPSCSRLPGVTLLEDPPQRLRWQAHLEFTHNHDVGDLTWDKIAVSLPRSEKLRSLVLAGIPHSMRPQLWMRLSGALQKKRNSELSYREVVKNSSNDETIAAKQIEKDLLRTMPSNACFANVSSIGVPRLRRVLRALAWLYPEIGYCQGTGMVAACLLLFLEEEDAFWMMCAIIEDLLPASYFSTTLLGVQTDQRVLRHLIVQYLPRLDKLLQEHDIELSLITLHWFLTAFASVVHIKLLLRLWDLFFYEGSLVLFQTTLGMLRLKVCWGPVPPGAPPLGGLPWGSAFSTVRPGHRPLLRGPRWGGVPWGPGLLVLSVITRGGHTCPRTVIRGRSQAWHLAVMPPALLASHGPGGGADPV